MLGVKLRSENIDQFDVLGERGQAVHLVASQILSVLKNKRPDLLVNFAVPQPSENGARIDWYAPSQGAVIAWHAATSDEQAGALARLDSVRAGVAQLRESIESKGSGNDAALLARLLKWIVHHPDPSYVFLVGGQPVITFWGFQHAGMDRSVDPLHALRSADVQAATPLRAAVADAGAGTAWPGVTLRRPWWKRWQAWLALLLPLLALLALLFGLRACMPDLAAKLSLPAMGSETPREPALPDAGLPMPTLPKVAAPGADVPAGATLPAGGGAGAADKAGANPPEVAADPAATPSAHPTANPVANPGADPAPAPAGAPSPAAQDAGNRANALPPTLPDNKEALQIPASTRDGKADFLNGNWRAGAGIQDRDTGEPLRLQYQFKNGEGQVTLNRHNGVQCTAPVSAAMNQGSLSIRNGAAAKCSDGGTYDMPLIQCKPGAKDIASCAGNYGDDQFPMSMRRAQP
ncbi:SrfA family protein [Bordetella sp. LUAb4]|uniref:SrfA family protein n=1 Tax=Bordetella sp. LUAb4 TaxID=2843195 RepID=UPI001E2FA0F9|nr:SrfA family protein [Bordetella sp. LUAb4]